MKNDVAHKARASFCIQESLLFERRRGSGFLGFFLRLLGEFFALRSGRRTKTLRFFREFFESIDAARCINALLFPGIERMAIGADVDIHLASRRTGRDDGSAAAGNGCSFRIGRMNTALHKTRK